MSKDQMKIKQHFVPRMYLKRWIHDSSGEVYVLYRQNNFSEVESISVDDERFYREYCYDIKLPSGKMYTQNEVEKILDEYEKRHNRLIDRIIERCDKNIKVLDRGTNKVQDLLEFVYLMIIRNPYTNLPLNIGNIETTSTEMTNLFLTLFGDKWSLTGLQVAANSADHSFIFDYVDEMKTKSPFLISFLKSTDKTEFITSDNPVIYQKNFYYLPISPQYACYIVMNNSDDKKLYGNTVVQLTDQSVSAINKWYWVQTDYDTLISANKEELEHFILKRL